MTFGTRKNYRTENVTFDVSDMPLLYNGILGRPALANFMAVAHYAYNTLKMPAEWLAVVWEEVVSHFIHFRLL